MRCCQDGCWFIRASAFCRSEIPGSRLNQVDAPDGCGSGITSHLTPNKVSLKSTPITSDNLHLPSFCSIANLQTGMTRLCFKMRKSYSIKLVQLRISIGEGTRSPPLDAFPGKQRQTADIYARERNCSSSSPMVENHLKRVLPAVQANGRPAAPSLGPGACPIK